MYGGDISDYYRDRALEGAISKMETLGYDRDALSGFDSTELDIMYDRLMELRRIERSDALLERLNKKK